MYELTDSKNAAGCHDDCTTYIYVLVENNIYTTDLLIFFQCRERTATAVVYTYLPANYLRDCSLLIRISTAKCDMRVIANCTMQSCGVRTARLITIFYYHTYRNSVGT